MQSWMPRLLRQAVFWTVIGVLILLGTHLRARSEPIRDAAATRSSPSRVAPAREGDASRAEAALFQSLKCAVSLLSFQLGAAEADCGEAIDLAPQSPVGYKFRGLAYLLEHRFERAENDFREAVRLDPKDSDNQAGYAQALSGQGRFGEAVAGFDAALKVSPRDIRYLGARCWALAGEGKKLTAALRDCNLALKLAPGSAVAYDSRGMVRLRMGKNAEAGKDYSRSLSLQPGRSTALFGRGMAELRQGLSPAARADIAQARRTDPEIDDIYILVGVLGPGCRDSRGSCELPDDLRNRRPQLPPNYLSVSYQAAPLPRASDSDAVQMLQAVELAHADRLLRQVAGLLRVRPPLAHAWQDADFQQLTAHLSATAADYARLRADACRQDPARNAHCAPAGQADTGIETLVGSVQPLWLSLCAQKKKKRRSGAVPAAIGCPGTRLTSAGCGPHRHGRNRAADNSRHRRPVPPAPPAAAS